MSDGTITVRLEGDDEPIMVQHMGDGFVVLSQFSEASGIVERVAGDARKLMAALLAYAGAEEPKNTDRQGEPAALEL